MDTGVPDEALRVDHERPLAAADPFAAVVAALAAGLARPGGLAAVDDGRGRPRGTPGQRPGALAARVVDPRPKAGPARQRRSWS
jgi:hypothetical protein